MPPTIIRKAQKDDTGAIWAIFKAVIQSGDTYVFLPDTPRPDLDKYWLAAYMRTYVAEVKGDVVGTYSRAWALVQLCAFIRWPKPNGWVFGQYNLTWW
jgi:hypothetical protein